MPPMIPMLYRPLEAEVTGRDTPQGNYPIRSWDSPAPTQLGPLPAQAERVGQIAYRSVETRFTSLLLLELVVHIGYTLETQDNLEHCCPR